MAAVLSEINTLRIGFTKDKREKTMRNQSNSLTEKYGKENAAILLDIVANNIDGGKSTSDFGQWAKRQAKEWQAASPSKAKVKCR